MAGTPEQGAIGIRAQRKQLTREELLQAAREMFAERGYDNVTVAEIAAGAGVSVKTLFQHFRSKEDLLFNDLDETHQRLVDALRTRDRRQSVVLTVQEWLIKDVENDSPDSMERFHRTVGDSAAVAALRRRLYEDWENAVVQVLAEEANEASPTPRTRLIAAELICMIRVLSSPEVREFVTRHPIAERPAVTKEWVLQAADQIEHGLSRPGSRRGR